MAVGQNVLRKEGLEKLTGAARYVDDITLEGMLFGKIVLSRIPRGRIKTINFDNYDDVEIQEPNTSRVLGSGPTVASRACLVVGRVIRVLSGTRILLANSKSNNFNDFQSDHAGEPTNGGSDQPQPSLRLACWRRS